MNGPPPPVPDSSDLIALAKKLQEAAEALLAVSQRADARENVETLRIPPATLPGQRKTPHEIRSYEVPDYALEDERSLLEASGAEDLPEALNRIYDQIFCIVNLMKHVSPEAEVSGADVNSIANLLSLPLDWLERLCSLLVGFRLVQHIKTK